MNEGEEKNIYVTILPSIFFHSFNSYLIESDTQLRVERCRVSTQFALLKEYTAKWRIQSVKSNDTEN